MNLLATAAGRKVLFGALYFSEGAPIGFIWWALPTRLRAHGVEVEQITALTSLLVLPWVFKFFWAPLVDIVRFRRWTRRAWIVAAQVCMGVSLLPLLVLDFHHQFEFVVACLVFHAVSAATQDAAIDALSIASVPAAERGTINGWMQAGMLAGRSLFGGGALLAANSIGDRTVLALLIAVVWASMTLVIFSKPVAEFAGTHTRQIADCWQEFATRFGSTVRQRTTWGGLLFALISAAGFEAVGAVAGPYLIDHGFNTEQVGLFFGVLVVVGMLSGALIGGYLADKIGRATSVKMFLITFVGIIFAIAFCDIMFADAQPALRVGLLSLLYLAIGMFTASSYAMFMDITDQKLGATQFSAYMGATNGCESWATFAVGKLIPVFGYPFAFASMAFISLAALPIVGLISHSSHNRGRSDI